MTVRNLPNQLIPFCFWYLMAAWHGLQAQPTTRHNLSGSALATRWDEAIPLGNGMLGALVWQRDGRLRFSLDRADLWDLRPMKNIDRPEFRYDWIYGQVQKNDYKPVQQLFDDPYDKEPAPSKIPGGALEFDTRNWGTVQTADLTLSEALCRVRWSSGVVMHTFVHATQPAGWFRIEQLPDSLNVTLLPPKYQGTVDQQAGGPVEGDDLTRLGYQQGPVQRVGRSVTYQQAGWGGFRYEISVRWQYVTPTSVEGVWSITSVLPGQPAGTAATQHTRQALQSGMQQALATHKRWWEVFWSKSAISVPDSLLERQWYLEQYKFGATARADGPPISLQAVWTADNGRLPPWKGDYHHDLNTQLSYWPAYSGNHLTEAIGYLNYLDQNQPTYRQYTSTFFNRPGLAVPGVTTLDGKAMGGWVQYSCSPTTSAWLGHHYYLHWRYTMDPVFLRDRAYPWIQSVAQFLEAVSVKNAAGRRQLPIGSSPEINNNKQSAWFTTPTNYDLSLMRFTFAAATEMAGALNRPADARHWQAALNELPDYALTAAHELMFAPTLPYGESHRHFSHLMAIHPLGLIRWENGETDRAIITASIRLLEKIGPDWWCGYSYAWLGNLKARAKDGAGAAEALRIFARDFCSINSFHLNGDQSKSGKSKFTYRPFTLEGNFAAAAGLQEMLLQSYAGRIEVMPAIPTDWLDVSFRHLRAEGAFLVDADRKGGSLRKITVVAERGGHTRLKLPFTRYSVVGRQQAVQPVQNADEVVLTLRKGERITFISK